MSSDFLFDLVVAGGLVWSAVGALLGRDRYRAVILFIVFGLLMTLAWVRLAAPDIALAEAAIGAGLTGALLLDALGGSRRQAPQSRGRRLLMLAMAAGFGGLLVSVVVTWPGVPSELPAAVATALPQSGVSHPVTAVLLNFRGYDTLLEVAVLLAALLGVLSVVRRDSPARLSASPMLQAVARMLVPLMVLTSAYLLWAGAHRPGGAFQAAAILAAAAVLLVLVGLLDGWARPSLRLRLAIAAGPAVFLFVAAPLFNRTVLLYLPPVHAGWLILAIESALTLSLSFVLAGLFLAVVRGDPLPSEES